MLTRSKTILKRKLQSEEPSEIDIKCGKRDNSETELTDKSTSPIDILNQDSLLIIFSYLTIKDLITVEQVSKKWKELSLMSWVNIKKINLQMDIITRRFSLDNLEDVLKRGGKYLTHLNLKRAYGDKTPANHIISAINKYCPYLTHLNLYLCCKGRKKLNLSKSIAKNLKFLEIYIFEEDTEDSDQAQDIGQTQDSDLSHLLANANNLEKLKVELKLIKGQSLLNLTDKCKSLSIPECESISNETFEEVLKRIPNIEHLNISKTFIYPETLKPISNQLKTLNVSGDLYDFPFNPHFFASSTYKDLSFSNLHTLILTENCDVNDNVLCYFIDKCPLIEDLNLCNDLNITDTGFRYISKLKNLISLNLGFTNLTDEAMNYLGSTLKKLTKLICPWLKKGTAAGFLQVIKNSSQLRILAIGDTDKYTIDFFESAEKYVLERSNNLSLTIEIFFPFGIKKGIGITRNYKSEIERLRLTPLKHEKITNSRFRIVEYKLPGYSFKRWNENEVVWCCNKDGGLTESNEKKD